MYKFSRTTSCLATVFASNKKAKKSSKTFKTDWKSAISCSQQNIFEIQMFRKLFEILYIPFRMRQMLFNDHLGFFWGFFFSWRKSALGVEYYWFGYREPPAKSTGRNTGGISSKISTFCLKSDFLGTHFLCSNWISYDALGIEMWVDIKWIYLF